MSTDALAARVAALEAQVQALQQQASADSIQPNVFQINPDGTVTALLTGALLLDEFTSDAYAQGHAVSWQDAADVIREWIQGSAVSTNHQLQLWSQADTDDFAWLLLGSVESGGAGDSVIAFALGDSTENLGGKLMDSAGNSSFLQLASIALVAIETEAAFPPVTPGNIGAVSGPYTVNFPTALPRTPKACSLAIGPGGGYVTGIFLSSAVNITETGFDFYITNVSPFNLPSTNSLEIDYSVIY